MLQDKQVSGNLAANGDVFILDVRGMASAAIQVVGAMNATLQFEGTIDGSTWFSVNGTPPTTTTAVTSATAAGAWLVNCGGLELLRVRCSARTSGTPLITLRATLAGGGSASAGGGGAATIADGADVNAGSTTDAAVVTDANGTLSSKLRGIIKMLADVYVTAKHILRVGGTYNSSDLSLSNGDDAAFQFNNQGKLKVIMNDSVGVYTDDNAGTSSLANDNDANTQSAEKRSTVGVDLSGTWVGTANFEARISDTTSYVPVKLMNVSTGEMVSSPTANGQFVGSIAGFRDFRVRFGKTSGTLVTSVRIGIGNLILIPDANGNLKVALASAIAGEDLVNDVLKSEQQFLPSGVLATDTQVKGSAGFVHSVTIAQTDAAPTAGTIDIYDNTSAAGTKIFSWTLTTAVFNPFTIILDQLCSTGIYVDFTTTADVGVSISYR